jgi:hypothetical protein
MAKSLATQDGRNRRISVCRISGRGEKGNRIRFHTVRQQKR